MIFILELFLELSEVSYDELRQYKMSPGDLYWKNSSGNTVLLRKRGDWLDFSYLEKFEKRNITLFISQSIDIQWLTRFHQITTSYMEAKTLREKEIHWKNWLLHVRDRYWSVTHPDGAFELKLLFENIFYDFNTEETDKNINADLELFDRYLHVAADVVFLLLLLGFNDFHFLKSMYRTTLLSFDFIKKEKLTVSIKKEIADFLNANQKLSTISLENYMADVMDEDLKYWTAVLFEDLRAENGLLKVSDNEIGDVERVLIFSNRTRSLIGKESDTFVFDFLKKNQLKFMSPHLMKKINFLLKEPELIAV